MGGSGGGSATHTGIDFQQRLGAFVMAMMLARSEITAGRLPWNPHRVTSLHFETDDAVDDLVVRTTGPAVLIQAKHALAFSSRPGSEFSAVIGQFVAQFRRAPDADERYVIGTSGQASRTVTTTLAKLTRAARLHPAGPAGNPLTKVERATATAVTGLVQHHFGVRAGRPATPAELHALLRRIRVGVFDVRAGGDLELAAVLALATRYGDNAALVWSALITKGLELASERLSIDAAALEQIVARYAEPEPARTTFWDLPYLDDAVDRPALMRDLVHTVTSGTRGSVTAVTGLHGAGGFGKTTLARQLCDRPEVRREYQAVLWVTLGESAHGAVLAGHLNDLVEHLTGDRPALTDPQAAGFRLGRALDAAVAGRTLLVIDDCWSPAALRPFLSGGTRCTRLVTTRSLGVVSLASAELLVDRMDPDESAAVLTRGIDRLPQPALAALSRLTGRWPVLLRIANRALQRRIRFGAGPAAAAAALVAQLEDRGPAALDLANAGARDASVAATVSAGLSLLSEQAAECYHRLAIFAEDAEIPLSLLPAYWDVPDPVRAEEICLELAELSLVADLRLDARTMRIHDVLRRHLRQRHRDRLTAFNDQLVTALQRRLAGRPWWFLPPDEHYARDHLVHHLRAAGRDAEGLRLVTDPRWAQERIQRDGVARFEADLACFGTPVAAALRTVVRQSSHLLGPTEPPAAAGAVLLSRMTGDPVLEPVCREFAEHVEGSHLRARTAMPDLPHPALQRVLPGHPVGLTAIAAAADESWIATVDGYRTVAAWDPRDGRRLWAAEEASAVREVLSSADSCFLISVQTDSPDSGLVRIREARTGHLIHTVTTGFLLRHTRAVQIAVAPAGHLFALIDHAGERPVAKLYDVRTGEHRQSLDAGGLEVVAFSPDGQLLATGGGPGQDGAGEVHLWETGTGRRLRTFGGHRGGISAIAFAPDADLIGTAGHDGILSIRQLSDGRSLHSHVLPGRWRRFLFTGGNALLLYGEAGPVDMLDADSGRLRCTTAEDIAEPVVAAFPRGAWFAVADKAPDGNPAVQIWDSRTGTLLDELPGHSNGVQVMTATASGALLTGDAAVPGFPGGDRAVRIWADVTTGRPASRPRHCVTLSPDGRYAVFRQAGVLSVRSVGTDRLLAGLPIEGVLDSLCFAPDMSWLAVASAGRIEVFDLASAALRLRIARTDVGHLSLTTLPDGTALVGAARPRTIDEINRQLHYPVRVWDLATGQQRAELPGHRFGVGRTVVAPTGTHIVTCEDGRSSRRDPRVSVWRASDGTPLYRLPGFRDGVGDIAAGPDGGWLAAGEARLGTADDCRVLLWNTEDGTVRGTLDGHRATVTVIAVSPAGRWLATGDSSGTIRIWSVSDLRLLHDGPGHGTAITAIAWSPDGRWLAATEDGGGTGTLRIIDSPTGETVSVMRVDGPLWDCRWLPDLVGLSARGSRGLYTFDWCRDPDRD